MPLFISYSHSDKNFVDRLAAQLVLRKVHVWLDRWEYMSAIRLSPKCSKQSLVRVDCW